MNPTDDQFPLVIPVPLAASDVDGPSVNVSATLDGASTGSHVATSEIPVVNDTRLEIIPNTPSTWSPCMGALPITFVASNVGHSPTAAATVELSPEIVKPGDLQMPEPVISAGSSTYTATAGRARLAAHAHHLEPPGTAARRTRTSRSTPPSVQWRLHKPSLVMAPPQPGDTVLGSASWTFPSIDPLHRYS